MTITSPHCPKPISQQGTPLVKKKNANLTRLRNTLTRDGGFTLIEVLAVMVIVALLVGVAVIGVGKWREKAALTSMKTDARNVALGIAKEDTLPATVAPDGDPFHRVSESNSVSAYTADLETETFSFEIHNAKTSKAICYSSVSGVPRTCEGTGDGPGEGDGSNEEESTAGPTAAITHANGEVTVRISGLEPNRAVMLMTRVGDSQYAGLSGNFSADGDGSVTARTYEPPRSGTHTITVLAGYSYSAPLSVRNNTTTITVVKPAIWVDKAVSGGQHVFVVDNIPPGTTVVFNAWVVNPTSGQQMQIVSNQAATAGSDGVAEYRHHVTAPGTLQWRMTATPAGGSPTEYNLTVPN